MISPWYCYLLASEDSSRTYIGATIDPDRRLHQHNGHKGGGAKATRGRTWHRVALVAGFPDERAALQFEWAWKWRSRQQPTKGLRSRVAGLWVLLDSQQPTSKSIAFSEWLLPPTVVLDLSSL
jgi:predicted GIY-YIG superfamily endonuclease